MTLTHSVGVKRTSNSPRPHSTIDSWLQQQHCFCLYMDRGPHWIKTLITQERWILVKRKSKVLHMYLGCI